jgi:hypothetical protein
MDAHPTAPTTLKNISAPLTPTGFTRPSKGGSSSRPGANASTTTDAIPMPAVQPTRRHLEDNAFPSGNSRKRNAGTANRGGKKIHEASQAMTSAPGSEAGSVKRA